MISLKIQSAFTATITEDEVKQWLLEEVLAKLGGLNPDGSMPDGISFTIRRGDSRKGGYTVQIHGPAPTRLLLAQVERANG